MISLGGWKDQFLLDFLQEKPVGSPWYYGPLRSRKGQWDHKNFSHSYIHLFCWVYLWGRLPSLYPFF